MALRDGDGGPQVPGRSPQTRTAVGPWAERTLAAASR